MPQLVGTHLFTQVRRLSGNGKPGSLLSKAVLADAQGHQRQPHRPDRPARRPGCPRRGRLHVRDGWGPARPPRRMRPPRRRARRLPPGFHGTSYRFHRGAFHSRAPTAAPEAAATAAPAGSTPFEASKGLPDGVVEDYESGKIVVLLVLDKKGYEDEALMREVDSAEFPDDTVDLLRYYGEEVQGRDRELPRGQSHHNVLADRRGRCARPSAGDHRPAPARGQAGEGRGSCRCPRQASRTDTAARRASSRP